MSDGRFEQAMTVESGPVLHASFDPWRAIRAGWVLIGIVAGVIAAWATTAELTSTIVASGRLVVESARKSVQHLEGGIVAEVLVQDGDFVVAGETLLRMNDSASRSRRAIIRAQLDAALAERARAVALLEGREALSVPEELRDRLDEPRVAQIVEAQRTLFGAEKQARAGQSALLVKRTEIIREQIAGLVAQRKSKEEQRRIILVEYANLKVLFDKGIIPQTRVLALERTASDLLGEIGSRVSEIASAEKEISEIELQIVQLENGYKFKLNDEIKAFDAEIGELRESLRAIDDVLQRSTVVALTDGLVLSLAVQGAGEVVRAGQTLLELVPVSDNLVVKAELRPQDIDNVALGQAVKVRFSVFDTKYAPEVEGLVSYISADILENAKTGRSFYEVKIALEDSAADVLDGRSVLAGMPAEAFIFAGSQTVFDYLVQPIASAMRHAMHEK